MHSAHIHIHARALTLQTIFVILCPVFAWTVSLNDDVAEAKVEKETALFDMNDDHESKQSMDISADVALVNDSWRVKLKAFYTMPFARLSIVDSLRHSNHP